MESSIFAVDFSEHRVIFSSEILEDSCLFGLAVAFDEEDIEGLPVSINIGRNDKRGAGVLAESFRSWLSPDEIEQLRDQLTAALTAIGREPKPAFAEEAAPTLTLNVHNTYQWLTPRGV